MAFSRKHHLVMTSPDDPAYENQPSNWNEPHDVADAVSGGIPFFSSTTAEGTSALLASGGLVIGGGAGAAPFTDSGLTFNPTTDILTVAKGITAGGPIIVGNAGVPDYALQVLNDATSAAPFRWYAIGGIYIHDMLASVSMRWNGDAVVERAAANSVRFSGAVSTTATSRTEINKAIASIADNSATAALTVTIPNGAHSASIRVRLTGSMGAGGAIGANESTQDAEYMINVARTAGVNAVATIGAVVGQAAAAAVAGAGTVAVTGELSAISGAVGATNTFTINVKIVKSGGSSANHTCFAFAELLNANASGVTIA